MDNVIVNITDMLKNIMPPELIAFLVSIMPILELRGGILAAKLLGVQWFVAYIVCVIGTMLPVPFILLFIRKIFDWAKNTRFVKLVNKLEEKAQKKSKSVEKYQFLGLLILVAIPLPGTGAWTGALVAAFMNMRIKQAILPIFIGTLVAGLIMTLVSYGLLGFVI